MVFFKKALIWVGFFIVVAPWQLLAQNLEDGEAAYNKKEYHTAVDIFRKLAGRGNPQAQFYLGYMHEEGQGVDQDAQQALRLYKKAGVEGHVGALNNLAAMYVRGDDIKKDHEEAVRLYKHAVEKGSAVAQENLGDLYRVGSRIEQDYSEAARLYRLASRQKNTSAQAKLAYMHAEGLGVKRNYGLAADLYEFAAKQGNASAQNGLGSMYREGQGVKQDYAEAVRLYTLAAEQKHPLAQTRLGNMYREGLGVQKDEEAAIVFYEKAIENGSVDAMVALGRMYRNHEDFNVDNNLINKAVKLFSAAADEGDSRAQVELGRLYQDPPMIGGVSIKKDMDVAIKLYRLAADQDYSYGLFMLGYIYSRYIKDTTDPASAVDREKAAELYTKASDKGLPIATAYLARAYLQGNGVRRDRKYALDLLNKAAEEGVGKAFNLLGKLYDPEEIGLWSVKDLNIEKDLRKSYKMYQMAADKGIYSAAQAASRKKMEIESIGGEALREEQIDALGSTPTAPPIFVKTDTQHWDCKGAVGDLILDDLYDVVRKLAIRKDIPEPDSDSCSYSLNANQDADDNSKRVRINWYTSADDMETCLRETCATKYTASLGVWGAHMGNERTYASIQVVQPILSGVEKENNACLNIEADSVKYQDRQCEKLSALRR
jgi:hypothetical protein